MIVEGAASKVGLPITRDPGRVLRPGDPGFPGTPEKPKTRACVQCQREFTRTSNAQKRCPACAAKVKPPAGKAAAEPAAAKARTTAMRRAPKPRAPAVGGGAALTLADAYRATHADLIRKRDALNAGIAALELVMAEGG